MKWTVLGQEADQRKLGHPPHTHLTALWDFVQDYLGEPAAER